MTPIEHYEQTLKENGFLPDNAQLEAVKQTQNLYEQLLISGRPGSLLASLFSKPKKISGLYLFGGTGRGKTWLVDSFYSCLPFTEKYRIHYNHFMRDIHERLGNLPKSSDPLTIIAKELSGKFRVLCIDEFRVTDIVDAMIMAGLLKAMFENNITLVATSNISINDLYPNGLQRDLFLYAIDLLHEHTESVPLGDGIDYRYHSIEKSGSYCVLSDADNNDFLEKHMNELAPCIPKHNRELLINKRGIAYKAFADDIIWFDFNALCNTPRSPSDYIKIAEMFHTVLIGNVPVMTEEQEGIAKRFLHLIDALYDHKVNLIMTAYSPPAELYSGRAYKGPFKRIVSRLTEMDSKAYFSIPHIAGLSNS